MNIDHTRAMVRAALNGRLDDVPTVEDPVFRVAVPVSCPDVPPEFLQPRNTWPDKDAYDRQARKLAKMFADNFANYHDGAAESVRQAGPRVDD
jgi:phosphoenolpyruvate carboxykinase (ATP)